MSILLHLLEFEKSDLCTCEICPVHPLFLPSSKTEKGMSSDNNSVSSPSSSSGSGRSREECNGRSMGEGSGQLAGVGRIPIEVTVETRQDSPEELAESSLSIRVGYRWVAEDVQTQYSLCKWFRLPIFKRNIRRNIMSLERVNAIDCICHG